ncbi:MAG: hypothetical protein JNJ90_08890 [Saprospiraceae bacterium]|nr:hypothetical protein [Saprospiraceae bacterium]
MKQSVLLSALIVVAGSVFAQNNDVVFRFDHRVGSEPLALNSTIFTLPDGRKALLTRAEFYIAEIELNKPDGSKLPLNNVYLLVNANTPNRTYGAGIWPVEQITGLTLHLGVDAAHNHLDPSAYPAGHPLANQNPTMHWGWTAGYRFMAIEGLLDKNGDNIPETIFQYHNLGDSLYQTVELTGTGTLASGVLQVDLKLDYARLFDKLDMSGNLTQHGSGPINATMMQNAATKNFIAFGQASSTGMPTLQSAQISASPNPARTLTSVRYDLKAQGPLVVVLTNTLGQPLRRFENLPHAGVLDIQLVDVPPGLYHYAFYDASRLIARKQLVIIE